MMRLLILVAALTFLDLDIFPDIFCRWEEFLVAARTCGWKDISLEFCLQAMSWSWGPVRRFDSAAFHFFKPASPHIGHVIGPRSVARALALRLLRVVSLDILIFYLIPLSWSLSFVSALVPTKSRHESLLSDEKNFLVLSTWFGTKKCFSSVT